MRDPIVVLIAIASCALVLIAHVSIIAALATRHPRWRAVAAFVVPPLAPYWAMREKLRGRAITWIASAIVYVIARIAAS